MADTQQNASVRFENGQLICYVKTGNPPEFLATPFQIAVTVAKMPVNNYLYIPMKTALIRAIGEEAASNLIDATCAYVEIKQAMDIIEKLRGLQANYPKEFAEVVDTTDTEESCNATGQAHDEGEIIRKIVDTLIIAKKSAETEEELEKVLILS